MGKQLFFVLTSILRNNNNNNNNNNNDLLQLFHSVALHLQIIYIKNTLTISNKMSL